MVVMAVIPPADQRGYDGLVNVLLTSGSVSPTSAMSRGVRRQFTHRRLQIRLLGGTARCRLVKIESPSNPTPKQFVRQ